ncbi:methyltransferase domain-containing protein [Hymenobacter sp. UYCo722]|uniref:class I SAM-dependent methyltransferase n=1 Tax=Hymenobacter sp. UYCo722 TaxID=3156335 RepID=UPI003396C9A6
MDLKELENGVDADTHWYYQSKKLPLLRFANQLARAGKPLTIIDIGAGSGFFAYELEKTMGAAIAKVWLVDIGYSEAEMAPTCGTKIEKVHDVPTSVTNGLFIMMDVLEHLPDDLAMLQRVKAASVGDNNYFFITVPAFQSLWSGHDVFLEHYRRYHIPMLSGVLRQAGFRRIRNYYLYGALFPLVWTVRRLGNMRKSAAVSNMKPMNPLVNKVLLGLNSLEMRFARANRVAGVTCVGEGQV